MPVHIRQAEVPSLESIRQFVVIKAEKVQNRRVEIVDVDRILLHVPADFVRLADDLAAFDFCPGEQS